MLNVEKELKKKDAKSEYLRGFLLYFLMSVTVWLEMLTLNCVTSESFFEIALAVWLSIAVRWNKNVYYNV